MNKIIEVNQITGVRKDSPIAELNSASPIVKAYSALVAGKEITGMEKKVADACVAKLKELNSLADAGDMKAISELNTIRTYVVNPVMLEEMKLFGFFGGYENVGFDETIERKAVKQNINVRGQALNGDVPFSFNYTDKYAVPTTSLAAGYEVDYRRAQFGDMSAENALIENIKTTMRNKAAAYAFDTVIGAISNATIKNMATGVTRQNVNNVINKARPFGSGVSLIGDVSAVTKINDIATYSDNASTPYLNISQAAMEEIRKNAYISAYMGASVVGLNNAYDVTKLNATGDWFEKIAPDRYIFAVPTGEASPIKLWTRGGLTSFTGTDVSTGRILTRYDLEVAADVAKGEEYKIGVIDTL